MSDDEIGLREEELLNIFIKATGLDLSELSPRRYKRLKEVLHAIAVRQQKTAGLLQELKSNQINIANIAKDLNVARCSLHTNEQVKTLIQMFSTKEDLSVSGNSSKTKVFRDRIRFLEEVLENHTKNEARIAYLLNEREQMREQLSRQEEVIKDLRTRIKDNKKKDVTFKVLPMDNDTFDPC